MKKTFSVFLIINAGTFSICPGNKRLKTGWKFGGALPAITFDSDLGFQYGALVEFFNYGDGRNLSRLLTILILRYRVTQKEAVFTGSCMNQNILFPECR